MRQAYYSLRSAIKSGNGVNGAFRTYMLAWEKQVSATIKRLEVMTKAEYHAKVNKPKKRVRRKKDGSVVYQNIGQQEVIAEAYSPMLDVVYVDDTAWIDEFVRKQEEDSYHGEF